MEHWIVYNVLQNLLVVPSSKIKHITRLYHLKLYPPQFHLDQSGKSVFEYM